MNTVTEQLKQLGIEPPKFGRGFTLGTNRTKCPECSADRKKSEEACLSVTLEEDGAIFHCHHCNFSGKVGAIISTRKTTFTKPDYVVADSLDSTVSSYFNSRGITDEVLKRNKIGYVQTFMPEGEVGAFTFPYFRGDDVVNVKYRSPAKSFKMERGAELCLYGLNDISGDTVVFVEGEIDKLSAEVAGITSCVSVPNGAPAANAKNVDNHLNYLGSTNQLEKLRRFIIATDSDAPGRALKAELVRRLGPERCWSVEWPEGVKDANEMLVKHGADSLREKLDNPEPVIPRLKRKKLSDKYLPPPPELAFHTPRGDIVLLQSITNHGKSTLLRNVAICMARGEQFALLNPDPQTQKKVLICNFEFSDPTSDLKKMLAGKSDYDNIEIIHSPRFGEADLNLSNYEHFKFFKDSCVESEADIIIIDTYASSFAVLNENDNAEATKNVKLLRGLAKDCNAVVVVSHHLGKMKPESEQTVQAYRGRGASALPGGAAAIFNLDASKDDFRFVTLTCAKNKSGLGEYKVPLELNTETRWFHIESEEGVDEVIN